MKEIQFTYKYATKWHVIANGNDLLPSLQQDTTKIKADIWIYRQIRNDIDY